MAVVSANPVGVTGKRDGKGIHITEKWRVVTDDPMDGPEVVLFSPLIPNSFQRYKSTAAYLRSVDMSYQDMESSRLIHFVTAEYSSESSGEDPDDWEIQIPINRPAKWSGNFLQQQAPLETDKVTGEPILNSAGDVFDEVVSLDDSQPLLTCRKSFSDMNLGLWLTYRDAVNSEQWGPFPPRTVKVQQISFTQEFYDISIPFYKLVFSFQVKDTWLIKLWSRGWRERINVNDPDDGTKLIIDPETGQVPPKPHFLDIGGLAIRNPDAIANEKHEMTFTGYNELPFSGLLIPAPLNPF